MSIIKGTNQIVAGFGGTKENIGDVKWSYSKLATDNSGRLPLFTGETIASANTIYPEFYNWVLAHTELQCTSAEYEASLTTYGECAKYVTKFPVTNTAYKYNLTGLSNALSSNYSFYKKNENGDYEAIGDQTYYYTNEEFIIEPLKSNEPIVFLDEKCTQKLYAEHHSGASAPGYYEVRLILVGPNSVKLEILLSDVSGLFIAPSSGSVAPSTIKNTETILTSTTYEVNGSLRLPLIKNYIKAATPTEGIKNIEAGLPNITGDVGVFYNLTWPTGAFYQGEAGDTWTSSGAGSNNHKLFDASRSSAVYGKSSTVTPASTTLYPWVVAYTAAIPASTAQAAEFQQGLSGKADTNLGNIPSNYDYVVESYNDGTNWYRKYKSGWVEQGGYYTGGNQIKTLLVPMANTNYTCLSACGVRGGVNWIGNPITIRRNSTTSISLNTYGDYTDCTGWWEVKGQSAS